MKDIGIRIREAGFGGDGPTPDTSDGATMADLLSAARRQYVPVLVCAFLGLMLGLAHYATSPPQYFAQARVLVEDRMSELAAEITANTPLVRNDTALLNEMQVLRSLQLATEVARNSDLTNNSTFLNPPVSGLSSLVSASKSWIKNLLPLPANPALESPDLTPEQRQARKLVAVASALQGNIDIERVGDSFSLNISMLSHDPALAADMVNAYSAAYLADNLNANLQASDRTAGWMRDRLDELLKTANAASREAEEFRANNKVSDLQGLRELEQRAETLNALHNTIAERYEQLIIEGSFPATNGRILTAAIAPKNPVSPRLWQFVSIAVLLGLIFGTAIAVLREYGERYLRTGEDVSRYTGLAFLGYLPVFNAKTLLKDAGPSKSRAAYEQPSGFVSSRREDASDTNAVAITPVDVHAPHLFLPVHQPRSIYSASLRNIHTTLEQSMAGKSGAVVGVTSMLPNEGNSTLAANYANMVAKFGARTLLVDGDVNHPALSAELNCSDGAGINQVLDGSCSLADAIRLMPDTGLDFLPCTFDVQPGIANEAVFRQSMPKLIAALRTHYDYVILDLPALNTAVDAKALLPEIDRIILTCEWGVTPRNLIRQYMAREPDVARKLLGIALSKVDVKALPKYSSFGSSESYLRKFDRVSA